MNARMIYNEVSWRKMNNLENNCYRSHYIRFLYTIRQKLGGVQETEAITLATMVAIIIAKSISLLAMAQNRMRSAIWYGYFYVTNLP